MVAYRSVLIVSGNAIALFADRNKRVRDRGAEKTDRERQKASFHFQIQRCVFASVA
jgi:hypothetical protein